MKIKKLVVELLAFFISIKDSYSSNKKSLKSLKFKGCTP